MISNSKILFLDRYLDFEFKKLFFKTKNLLKAEILTRHVRYMYDHYHSKLHHEWNLLVTDVMLCHTCGYQLTSSVHFCSDCDCRKRSYDLFELSDREENLIILHWSITSITNSEFWLRMNCSLYQCVCCIFLVYQIVFEVFFCIV